MWITLSILAILAISGIAFINQPVFGKLPKENRLERIKKSPNYRDGQFQNIHDTPTMTSDKGLLGALLGYFFNQNERLRPSTPLPVVKTDLKNLDPQEDLMIWFGHSSYLLQLNGKKILVDPVFYEASPVSFMNKPYEYTYNYTPEDMPEIDYLVISHDHWDHLDYKTIVGLKHKIKKVISGLGVGAHFEYWGYDSKNLIELDWNEKQVFDDGLTIHCFPTLHGGGRAIKQKQSLWASYVIEVPNQTVFIGGDGGYDTHFAEIGKQFKNIDLAILENGQYNEDWKYIHTLPTQLVPIFKDLKANKLFTVHHAKFTLATHPWDEPLENIYQLAMENKIPLFLPAIGEKTNLNDLPKVNKKWWEGID